MDRKRMISLLRILEAADQIVPGSVLCGKLNITDRTLRNDIRESSGEFFRNGFEIRSRHAVGYYLHVNNEEKYCRYLNRMMKEESENQMLVPAYPDDRVDYLIRLFLTAADYLKTDDLIEQLFVSHSTLSNDLKQVREKLRWFHLELESKPAHGLRISGSELHLRSAIVQYFFHTDSGDEKMLSMTSGSEEQAVISSLLYDVISEKKFHLTDIGFQDLVIHMMVAILRLRQNSGPRQPEVRKELEKTDEYRIAVEICRKLGTAFHVVFPKIETYYVAMHLAGKQAAQYHDIHLNYQDLIDEVLMEIRDRFRIDLTFDMDLRTALSLHLIPMMNRLKYDMLIQNPMLEKIKEEHTTAFEMSVLLAEKVHEKYALRMEDTEIGYVALHFALAIDRYKKSGSRKNIIVICASGLGSSQILLYKIRSRFHDSLGSVYTTQLYDLKNVDQSQYDFILTTVPIPFKTQIPAIRVQYFLDSDDIFRISEEFRKASRNSSMHFADLYFSDRLFFHNLTGKNRFEIIHRMCARISECRNVPDGFEEEVIRREKFADTEFGNYVAMPHPMNAITDDTFVAVNILKKPVHWGKTDVKYIFLISVKKDSQEKLSMLHESLSALVFDPKSLARLEKNPAKEELKQILQELAEQEKGNDLDTLFGS